MFEEACAELPGACLVAVGSYGRCELSPYSDLDLLLLHAGGPGVASAADRLWYPIWDANVRLDHSVRTVAETLAIAGQDLKAALGLLDARLVAGDRESFRRLTDRGRRLWEDRASDLLARLHRSVLERQERYGEVAFLLEPELKEGHGGLRDVIALAAATVARPSLGPLPGEVLEGRQTLLAIRSALHQRAGRPLDCLLLQEQDGVAADLGFSNADDLMTAVAGAARAIAGHGARLWRKAIVLPAARNPRRRRPPMVLAPGVVLYDGEVSVADSAGEHLDLTMALRVGAAAAGVNAPLAPETLAAFASLPAAARGSRLSPDTLAALVTLLGWGHPAIAVVEALDQIGVIDAVIPEWAWVRNRPQRNAYHRYTVDRHLLETAAQAAALTRDVGRPDLLLLAALLHDIGKGVKGRDHSEAGAEAASAILTRFQMSAGDHHVVVTLVRHHLLLARAATRRDIDDPATLTAVTHAVGDVNTLELLAALSKADGLATGSLAWTTWKESLVSALVERARRELEGRPALAAPEFPSPADGALMQSRQIVVRVGPVTTVIAPDQVGLLARMAGTLATAGLDVRTARLATRDGMAIEQFEVTPAVGDWPAPTLVESRIRSALAGELDLDMLLRRRREAYRRPRTQVASVAPPRVLFDRSAHSATEVVEVRCPDRSGILADLARVLTDQGLDVVQARASTLGHEVVDAFYVRPVDGQVLTTDQRAQLTSALLAAAAP